MLLKKKFQRYLLKHGKEALFKGAGAIGIVGTTEAVWRMGGRNWTQFPI